MANISHFTQTVNGVSTTYDIHDANAVDLTNNQTVGGNKEFTGTTTAHDVIPSDTDTYNLGTSTNKWKSINGIAPDELGLPTSTYTDVSSYITHFDNTPNRFTAPASGLLNVVAGYISGIGCVVFNDTIGIEVSSSDDAYGHSRTILPVEKGDSIRVVVNRSTSIRARIHHLKGKV